jgi:malate dehydrogenase (oxaloacetate-decarboxylating)
MTKINLSLDNLDEAFPKNFTQSQVAQAKTLFLKELAQVSHEFYRGKMQTIPKAPVIGFNWFNVWYTPGVSRISTNIRDNNDLSYQYSNRGNLIAVVSDSTRVLGDGNVTPSGGLGVMEGKAFLMKYLGGVDAVALCVDSRDKNGKNDPEKIIDFVKMLQYSFGGVNLEDISSPNCYKVLDILRAECSIPVWHDDAQGTACVTLAGLINALKLANKKMEDAKIVLLGAGASNTSVVRFMFKAGVDPQKTIMIDSKRGLHKNRKDIEDDPRFYPKWEVCKTSNPKCVDSLEEALKGADALVALSQPGPNFFDPALIKTMADKAIVFVCANPVPEIYPYEAKEAGAFITATGRGDFPNQVNNSLGFPGILKGALLTNSSAITDEMAIAASYSLARFAEKRGISPENIIPTMEEHGVFPQEAADVAMQAIKDGVARKKLTWDEAFKQAQTDIELARNMTQSLIDNNYIKQPPADMVQKALDWAIKQVS